MRCWQRAGRRGSDRTRFFRVSLSLPSSRMKNRVLSGDRDAFLNVCCATRRRDWTRETPLKPCMRGYGHLMKAVQGDQRSAIAVSLLFGMRCAEDLSPVCNTPISYGRLANWLCASKAMPVAARASASSQTPEMRDLGQADQQERHRTSPVCAPILALAAAIGEAHRVPQRRPRPAWACRLMADQTPVARVRQGVHQRRHRATREGLDADRRKEPPAVESINSQTAPPSG